jgi:hypothetical protein
MEKLSQLIEDIIFAQLQKLNKPPNLTDDDYAFLCQYFKPIKYVDSSADYATESIINYELGIDLITLLNVVKCNVLS